MEESSASMRMIPSFIVAECCLLRGQWSGRGDEGAIANSSCNESGCYLLSVFGLRGL